MLAELLMQGRLAGCRHFVFRRGGACWPPPDFNCMCVTPRWPFWSLTVTSKDSDWLQPAGGVPLKRPVCGSNFSQAGKGWPLLWRTWIFSCASALRVITVPGGRLKLKLCPACNGRTPRSGITCSAAPALPLRLDTKGRPALPRPNASVGVDVKRSWPNWIWRGSPSAARSASSASGRRRHRSGRYCSPPPTRYWA